MVGVTYGAVPLYRLFCQATGYGGTVQEGATVRLWLPAAGPSCCLGPWQRANPIAFALGPGR